MVLIKYIRRLHAGKLLLWCYFVWYLSIGTIYFDDDPGLWLTASGISLIIGVALLLSTSHWPIDFRTLDRWQTMRLFLIPFCVSSYSMLIKDKNCFLVFPPDIKTNVIALSAITAMLLAVWLIKKTGR